jgi:hypothetical protein
MRAKVYQMTEKRHPRRAMFVVRPEFWVNYAKSALDLGFGSTGERER